MGKCFSKMCMSLERRKCAFNLWSFLIPFVVNSCEQWGKKNCTKNVLLKKYFKKYYKISTNNVVIVKSINFFSFFISL